MIFDSRAYSILVVSSSEKFDGALRGLLEGGNYDPIHFVSSISSAKRAVLERSYDFIIVNSPLPDDIGTRFAIDATSGHSSVCLLLLRADICDEVTAKVAPTGVYTLPKPTATVMLSQALKWMASTRERLRSLEKKSLTIEEKMEEIRLVNRAKWLLIENLSMNEAEAHRYIEKQAMDSCISKGEVARSIINTYR